MSVPSSKNSRINTPHGSFFSKATNKYIKASAKEYTNNKDKFLSLTAGLPKPLLVSFELIRRTHHKFDLVNSSQIILDLMVKNGWITDDNADEIIPFFVKYKYDKKNPGVNIRVIKSVNINYI